MKFTERGIEIDAESSIIDNGISIAHNINFLDYAFANNSILPNKLISYDQDKCGSKWSIGPFVNCIGVEAPTSLQISNK